MSHLESFSKYSYEKIQDAMVNLDKRDFLHEVNKPYGTVYAVNEMKIANMMFVYS